ncbi:RtcB family protein [Granulicoccus sp. GXG6511]|uniref:RtcB family protein n=1 Tax=Granulicoccus sp. GXG6511 TaxID=3381351 RepID=UPI003D7D3056
MFPVALSGAPNVQLWAHEQEIEPQAIEQLRNIAALPWTHGVRVMPDVHLGRGATVGSVIAMQEAVAPAAVGVDIGCGMEGVLTSLTAADLPDDLGRLRRSIEDAIPVGFRSHNRAVDLRPLEGLLPRVLTDRHGKPELRPFFARFEQLTDHVQKLHERSHLQLGTLGGGNHFIEICLDTEDRVWLMLHSGSRNIGNELAKVHMETARALPHNQGLPDRDLAVFLAGTPEMAAYRHDLMWAQEYAARNRAVMLALLMSIFAEKFAAAGVRFDEPISCHHNYVAEELVDGVPMLITRKGAIRAGAGDMGLIPGSMGTRSYVVRGLGNDDSYQSASHGAGRVMSRAKAKKTFTIADLVAQTEGVESRKDAGVLDEIPGAYKDIDKVIEAQRDLVEVVATLRQVVCVKG